MIETFFIWLLGPTLAAFIMITITGATVILGINFFITKIDTGRWPWEKEK